MAANFVAYLAIFTFTAAFSSALASDPDLLQDVCVALPPSSGGVKVNGFACKDDANVTAADFFFDGLAKPGLINNSPMWKRFQASTHWARPCRASTTHLVDLTHLTLHPRATEIVFVLDGELDVGFITTANKLVSKTINKGDIFVFPGGLVHFQKNNGDKAAAVIAAFNSQLPGTQSIPAALFTATPPVPDEVLTKAFQLGTKEIDKIKSKLAPKK
ncbi:hypothetical protein GBA52_009120 [Prunus armeniaca]|nr:hypothetical protein GBA52_009120 [Prunus armeniaca]